MFSLIKSIFLLLLLAFLGLSIPSTPIFAQDTGTEDEFFGEGESEEESDDSEDSTELTDDLAEEFGDDDENDSFTEGAPRYIKTKKKSKTYVPAAQNKSIEVNYGGKEIKVRHPKAKKGLLRITRDRIYQYRVRKTKQKRSATLKFGLFEPLDLQSPANGAFFDELYPDSSNPMIMFDYEFLLFRGLGKTSWKLGSGIFIASGNGRFQQCEDGVPDLDECPNTDLVPEENFTFLMFPNSVGIIHKFQFWDTQWFVPFAEGGGDLFTFVEIRDDDEGPKFGLAPVAHASGGLLVNIGRLGKENLLILDAEYGINNIWLAIEYRLYVGLSDKFDFSGDFFNVGFAADF